MIARTRRAWLAVLVVSAAVAGVLTATATAGKLSAGDEAVVAFVLAHRWPPLDWAALAVSWAGSEYATPVVLAGLLLLWWRRGGLVRRAGLYAVGVAATSTLWQMALKAVAERPRPEPLLYPVWHGAGFPSGHVLTAIVLLVVLWQAAPALGFGPRARRWLGWGSLVWPLLMAWSRVYLNTHYLSDVAAGAALAGVHLGLAGLFLRLPLATGDTRLSGSRSVPEGTSGQST